MKQLGTSLCILLTFWATASVAQEPEFQFSRTITAPSISQLELLAVTLDPEVYAATQIGLPDLRLLDGQGAAVPYLVRKAQATRTSTVRKTWAASQPKVKLLEDGGLEITLRLADDDPSPQGLRLVSRLKDFEHRVRVYSSETGEQWQPLGEETVIFDYSRHMDVRRDRIDFNKISQKHLRIVIDNITAKQESELLALTRRLQGTEETEREEQVTIQRRPFRIERIEFWGQVKQERSAGDKKTAYLLGAPRIEQLPERKQTAILINTNREPLTSLKLETSAQNFGRRVVVEIEDQRGEETFWRKIGENTLSRIDFKGLNKEQLDVRFPESRRETYRLVIDNRDSPPLEVTGLKARGTEYELLFLASPDASYQLAYGSADADAPQYDTAAIKRVLSEGFQATEAALGAVGPGPVVTIIDQPIEFRWSDLLNNRALQISTITLLVIVLAWGLYHAAKRLDNLPE